MNVVDRGARRTNLVDDDTKAARRVPPFLVARRRRLLLAIAHWAMLNAKHSYRAKKWGLLGGLTRKPRERRISLKAVASLSGLSI
jgi:hypothetical protein